MNPWTILTMILVLIAAPLPPQIERFEDHVGGDTPRAARAVGVIMFDRAGTGALDDIVALYRDGRVEETPFERPAIALVALDTARGLRLGLLTAMMVTGTPAYSWSVPVYRGADTAPSWVIRFDAGKDAHAHVK